MTIPQYTSSEADTIKTETNDYYIDNDIDSIQCVKGRVNAYYLLNIPSTRVVEFNEGDDELQSNFITITVNAQAPEYALVDFVTAWETEYAKIYP